MPFVGFVLVHNWWLIIEMMVGVYDFYFTF